MRLLLLLLASTIVQSWNKPVTPFRIIDNVYYVGASEVTSYLITSPHGHILLDGGYDQTAPQILANIRTLGFRPEDVKVLIGSHPHFDHAGGLAQLKKETKAQFVATKLDAGQYARGGLQDFGFADRLPFPPVQVDRTIEDGVEVRAGDAVMTAHITPGHTKGCTTWSTTVHDKGKLLNVVFVCSASVPGYKLVPPAYPNIISDYEATFQKLRSLPCDVFLGAHGSFFNLLEKQKKLNGTANPFIDPAALGEYADRAERAFREDLARQRAAAK